MKKFFYRYFTVLFSLFLCHLRALTLHTSYCFARKSIHYVFVIITKILLLPFFLLLWRKYWRKSDFCLFLIFDVVIVHWKDILTPNNVLRSLCFSVLKQALRKKQSIILRHAIKFHKRNFHQFIISLQFEKKIILKVFIWKQNHLKNFHLKTYHLKNFIKIFYR